MALLEEWVLPTAVTAELKPKVAACLSSLLGRYTSDLASDEGALRAVAAVSAEEIVQFTKSLASQSTLLDHWDWEDEIAPLVNANAYFLCVEMVNKVPETFDWLDDEELPILSVYSKDRDNHAGWPAAFVLASTLARELGAVEPDKYPRQLN